MNRFLATLALVLLAAFGGQTRAVAKMHVGQNIASGGFAANYDTRAWVDDAASLDIAGEADVVATKTASGRSKWVMTGGPTKLNYKLSGKGQRGFGNQYAAPETAQTHYVPKGDLYSPKGLNPIDGRIKSVVPGQMRYYPEGSGLLTSGEAVAITAGRLK